MRNQHSTRLATCVIGLLCTTGTAWSQPYPSKPVRVIVPFPPAGANDIAARIIFPKVSELISQTFIIENRSGAGGTIGTAVVAQSKPDGYTLLVQSIASHVANAHLYRKLPYDALRDFVGVAPMARLTNVLTVHPSLPAYSVKEFIALARAQPGKLTYGSSGASPYLAMELFKMLTHIDVTSVAYKGAAPALADMMGGQITASVSKIGRAHV